jgi:hypothetical protein
MKMEVLATALFAGVLGTISMDLLNHAFSRSGHIMKIDVTTIGRMAAGWANGRLFYSSPNELKSISNEKIYRYIAHYIIGVSLVLPFILWWKFYIGGPVSPLWTLVYGLATTVASLFFVYPAMGLGFLGMRSPQGIRAPLSSIANHTFYGIGLAAGVVAA